MLQTRDKIINSSITQLYIALTLMILGYFTLTENLAITQILKIFLRIGMTGMVMLIYFRLKTVTAPSFQYNNLLSIVFYLLYLFLGFVSFAWSSKVSYSVLQWLMASESLVFAIFFVKSVVIIQYYFPEKDLQYSSLFGIALTCLLAAFLIGAILNPELFYRATRGGEEYRLGGYFMNPNELGMIASIGAALGIIEFSRLKNKIFPTLCIILNVLALVLTSSRSSTIGFLLIAFLLLRKYASPKMKLIAIIGFFITIPFILNTIILKAGDIDEVLSMTGRLPFWKALLDEGIVKEPFFGFGFMRIYYTDAFQSVHTYAGKMTHNTFMQVLMNLGFVGLFIVFVQMAVTLRAFFKMKNNINRNLFLAIFIPIFINSNTEFGFFGEANYAILFYQFLICFITINFLPVYTIQQKVKLKRLGLNIVSHKS